MYKNTHIYLVLLSLFIIFPCACSSIDESKPISNIEVLYKGKNNTDRPQMSSVCKGFYITRDKVQEFYFSSARIKDTDRKKYEILPCYSEGTAYLYGIKYKWIIRSGGVGEFFNDNDSFIKICGKNCCNKLERIC